MEDAIAEESFLQLAAVVGRMGQAQQSFTDIMPAQPVAFPTLAPGDVTDGAGGDSALLRHRPNPVVVDLNPSADGSLHHTLLPRTMVIAALLAALGAPLVAFVLERQGHLAVQGTNWSFDQHGRSVATGVVASAVAGSVLGWLWWTTAAAMNARKQARYTISPFFAPALICLMSGCAFLLVGTLRSEAIGSDEHTRKMVLVSALVAIIVISHFVILEAYRRAAVVIGAAQRSWQLVIVLPWVTLAANLLAQFFARTVGDSYLNVMALGNMFVCGVQVLALYQAMASFDRACSGRHMAHNERGELPDFMRGH